MTYTYEQTLNYMNARIDSMDHSIDWSVNHLDGWDGDRRRDWALEAISNHYDIAFGVITFAEVYLKGITEEEADDMRESLDKAYWSKREKIEGIDYWSPFPSKK